MIGAGVIGLELGSVYARLGSEVTVLEYLDQITPGMDLELCKALQKLLTKQGLKFVLGAAVQRAEPGKDGNTSTYKLRKDDSEASRSTPTSSSSPPAAAPITEGLGLADLGVELTKRGQIEVDARWQTDRPRHLRHRRRDRRPDARPQGRGRGHGRGRDPRRPARPRELRRDPRASSTPPPRSPPSARPRKASRTPAAPTRSASSPSSATPAPSRTSPATASSKILADKETDRILGAHIIGP